MILESLHSRARVVSGVISTDDILPAKYKHMYTDPRMLAAHVFENINPGFASTLKAGDALVSRDTFGIGSSREQAVTALQAAGVVAVFAPRFGSIFFRNAWNNALPAVTIDLPDVEEGDLVNLGLREGRLAARGTERTFPPVPAPLLKVVAAGGLLDCIRAGAQFYHDEVIRV